MKKLFLWFFLLSCVLAFLAYFLFISKDAQKESTPKIPNTVSSVTPIVKEEKTIPQEKTSEEIVRQKIETIKKRLALKGLIIEWDSYFRKQQLPLALKKYLEFYKKNPQDVLINEKIADTYFALRKFPSALNYYKKIQKSSPDKRIRIANTMLYSSSIDQQEERNKLLQEISTLPLTPEESFYYSNSISCVEDFHNCKVKFQEYFWFQDKNNEKKIEFSHLSHIKESIENYRNFQIDEVYLKNAYIIGAWYSDGLYPLTIFLGEKLLEEKKGYKPILKIVAQSYFKLGKYEKSRETFMKYYEQDDSDPAVAYFLGIINEKLRENVLANIYFNRALDLWYTPSIDIRRQLITNFYILKNDENMLIAFKNLIEKEQDFWEEDLGLGIYYHIINKEYAQALKWSKRWQEIFADNGNFYAYEWWILREQWKLDEAINVLNKWISIDTKNPFILINLAYTFLEQDNSSDAIEYFKKVLLYAPKSEFWLAAQKEIDTLSLPNTLPSK